MNNFFSEKLRPTLRKILPLRATYRFTKKYLQKLGILTDKPFPTRPYKFTRKDAKRVYDIVLSGDLHHTSGEEVPSFEREFASYLKTKYALATNAGTSALELALKAISIRPGDEVIVPAYTFVAPAQAVLARGGIPVFADIDDTFTISPESMEKQISKKTKAIIAVHIFGNVADMDSISGVAKKHNLYVIEDACQAVGAKYNGRPVGSMGDVGCFSFNETKAIFTGQGGMFVTSNKKFYQTAFVTRETGFVGGSIENDVISTGNTYAMTQMQAALGRSILGQLDKLNEKRRKNYELFTKLIDTRGLPLKWYRILPKVSASFYRLVFMIDFQRLGVSREVFIRRMRSLGIPMKTFYPTPLYRYSLFKGKRDILTKNTFPFSESKKILYRGRRFPFAEIFCKQQVGIAFSPYLSRENIGYFCDTLVEQMRLYLQKSK